MCSLTTAGCHPCPSLRVYLAELACPARSLHIAWFEKQTPDAASFGNRFSAEWDKVTGQYIDPEKIRGLMEANTWSMKEPHPGARWLTSSIWFGAGNSGAVISCYIHPTLGHTATTYGKDGMKRAFAPPRQWACSVQHGFRTWGTKAYYHTCDTVDCSELGAERPPPP